MIRSSRRLHFRFSELIKVNSSENELYQQAEIDRKLTFIGSRMRSASAGTIEQTFGGITANLWDDPFEWTLPETLHRSPYP